MKLTNLLAVALCGSGFQPKPVGKTKDFLTVNGRFESKKTLNDRTWDTVRNILFTDRVSNKNKLKLMAVASVAAYVFIPGIERLAIGLLCPALGSVMLLAWVGYQLSRFLAGKIPSLLGSTVAPKALEGIPAAAALVKEVKALTSRAEIMTSDKWVKEFAAMSTAPKTEPSEEEKEAERIKAEEAKKAYLRMEKARQMRQIQQRRRAGTMARL